MDPKQALAAVAAKLSDWVNTLPPSARPALVSETQAQIKAIEDSLPQEKKAE